jgi:XTP/dITP diphosphohydrolase
VGFEWDNREQVWEKVEEEQKELMEAVQSGEQSDIEEEFGDLMFSMINYARFLSIDAEAALERTNRKFINRFEKMEDAVGLSGKQINDLSLAELDAIWNEVKKQKTTD